MARSDTLIHILERKQNKTLVNPSTITHVDSRSKDRIEDLWIVWSQDWYVAPAVTVPGDKRKGGGGKKRERQRQILSHASSVSPSLLLACWTLTFHLNSSLTISWMPPSKACSLFICLPMQKKEKALQKNESNLWSMSFCLTAIALSAASIQIREDKYEASP